MSVMTIPDGVVMFHNDTDQQKRCLRSSKVARVVRAKYFPGARVRSSAGDESAPVGVVQYTVPSLNAQGGSIVVLWANGRTGRHSAISLTVLDEPQP